MLRSVRNASIVLLLVAALVPAGARDAAAIAHGEDAPEGAYPYAVLLTMTGLPSPDGGSRDSSCSGALIAPRWVITAGHCFRDADGVRVSATVADRTTATIGRTDLNGDAGREVEVVGVRQDDKASDVALAELAEAVTDITPLRIGTGPPIVGETLRLTGYGLVVDDAGTRSPTWLQTGQFAVQTVGDTLIETSGVAPLAETSPCRHDSGGPYVRELSDGTVELVAVVSAGPDCPHSGWDFSARVDTLQPWITDVMAGAGDEAWPLDRSSLLLAAGAALALVLALVLVVTRRHRRRRRPRPSNRAVGVARTTRRRPDREHELMLRSVRNASIVLLLVAALVPAGARDAAAIAHGEDAPEGAYPYAVLLTMTGLPSPDGGSRDSSCSGALIAPRWVITAGHCFRDADGFQVSATVADRTTATIGRADLNSGHGREVEVIGVRQAGEALDVALAELAEAVTDIAPLQISSDPPVVGETLRLTGYGLVIGDAGARYPSWLQTGQFTVQTVNDTLIETSGLAPRSDTSPCPHDSGGPYFRELPDGTTELVAVVSAGPDCPHSVWDFSARVDNLRPWVADVTAETEQETAETEREDAEAEQEVVDTEMETAGTEMESDPRLGTLALLLVAAAVALALILLAIRRRRRRRRDRRSRPTGRAVGVARPAHHSYPGSTVRAI